MDDALLRFYEQCPRYQEEVDDNPATTAESDAFAALPVFTEMVERVGERAGVRLSTEQAELIWDICRSSCIKPR